MRKLRDAKRTATALFILKLIKYGALFVLLFCTVLFASSREHARSSQLAALSTLLQSARSALFICPNGRERDRYVRLELSANDFLRQLIVFVFVCLVVDAGSALLQPSLLFCFTRARLWRFKGFLITARYRNPKSVKGRKWNLEVKLGKMRQLRYIGVAPAPPPNQTTAWLALPMIICLMLASLLLALTVNSRAGSFF